MPNVAISSDYLTTFAKIPQTQLNKSAGPVSRFQNNPTSASINYEPIHNVEEKRVRTVRIRLDFQGLVLHPEEGDIDLLMWVDLQDASASCMFSAKSTQ
jgi:hypothetical protein